MIHLIKNIQGIFITEIKGDISSSGSFIQKGLGTSFLSGDITTTTGGITFVQPVNFTGKPFFNARNNSSSTSVADITFLISGFTIFRALTIDVVQEG